MITSTSAATVGPSARTDAAAWAGGAAALGGEFLEHRNGDHDRLGLAVRADPNRRTVALAEPFEHAGQLLAGLPDVQRFDEHATSIPGCVHIRVHESRDPGDPTAGHGGRETMVMWSIASY